MARRSRGCRQPAVDAPRVLRWSVVLRCVAVLRCAAGQAMGDGVSKYTLPCNDPAVPFAWLKEYLPVVTSSDSCDGAADDWLGVDNDCACSSANETLETVDQGRVQLYGDRGFGLHLVNTSFKVTTGGLSVSAMEAVFEERLNDMTHFDSYMDYSVGLYAPPSGPRSLDAFVAAGAAIRRRGRDAWRAHDRERERERERVCACACACGRRRRRAGRRVRRRERVLLPLSVRPRGVQGVREPRCGRPGPGDRFVASGGPTARRPTPRPSTASSSTSRAPCSSSSS